MSEELRERIANIIEPSATDKGWDSVAQYGKDKRWRSALRKADLILKLLEQQP